jgi:DNA-directed RNA polymerase alpha subunit
MKITKNDVLKAIKVIDDYKKQEFKELIEIEQKSNIALDKRDIVCLNLKTRELRCLRSVDVNTVGELLTLGRCQLIKLRNMGPLGVEFINKALKDDGIETEPFKTI